MSNMTFDKEQYKKKLLLELGIPLDTPDNELVNYKMSIGNFFGNSDAENNVLDYISSEIKAAEEYYSSFTEAMKIDNFQEFKPIDINAVMKRLDDKLEEYDQIAVDLGWKDPSLPLLEMPKIEDLKFIYLCVEFNETPYVIAFPVDNELRTADQIKHITNTTYYIGKKNPDSLKSTDTVISYYQFVNLIEKEIAKQANAIRTKIGENVVTNFQSLEDLSNPLES